MRKARRFESLEQLSNEQFTFQVLCLLWHRQQQIESGRSRASISFVFLDPAAFARPLSLPLGHVDLLYQENDFCTCVPSKEWGII
jgi:hypothetical protein